MSTALQPAQITWRQISVGVKMSMGVRLPVQTANAGRTLVMKVGPNHSRYAVHVTINGHDLYDITLFKGVKEVWARRDIYAEYLDEVLLRMESENWG